MKLQHSVAYALLAMSSIASADQLVLDDQIISGGSLCVGVDCVDGEDFAHDTIRLKTDDPQIHFVDTSNISGFPSNDWLLGVTDSAFSTPPRFYVKDVTSGFNVLLLESGIAGGVALGASSTLEPNQISVGSLGNERKITHLDDGVNDTDAVNVRQFNQFVTAEQGTLNTTVETRIQNLSNRIDALIVRINQL